MYYIANAFSLGMLSFVPVTLKVSKISLEEVKQILDNATYVSAIGHASTAQLLSEMLQKEIPYNRIEVRLEPQTKLIVFQLLTRLSENQVLSKEEIMSLPHAFYLVEIV
jgi:hypothetical protein